MTTSGPLSSIKSGLLNSLPLSVNITGNILWNNSYPSITLISFILSVTSDIVWLSNLQAIIKLKGIKFKVSKAECPLIPSTVSIST